METIHIALPSDQNYVVGLLVTAGSICRYASKDVELRIHVLDGGIEPKTFQEIESKVRRFHPNVKMESIRVDERLFARFPAWSGNRMTYARLMLADALPDVEFIVYSDTDFLWHADIAELWQERSEEVPLISVVDGCRETIEHEHEWFENHGLPFSDNQYFCCGLSFYNLKKFREERIVEKVSEFFERYPDVRMADQSALNHLLYGRVKLVDEKWQTLSMCLTKAKVSNPVVIHYAGDIPWRRNRFLATPLSDAHLLWFRELTLVDGVLMWIVLRRYCTIWQIIYKRLLAKIVNCSILGWLFKFVLEASGRRGYYENIKRFAVPL